MAVNGNNSHIDDLWMIVARTIHISILLVNCKYYTFPRDTYRNWSTDDDATMPRRLVLASETHYHHLPIHFSVLAGATICVLLVVLPKRCCWPTKAKNLISGTPSPQTYFVWGCVVRKSDITVGYAATKIRCLGTFCLVCCSTSHLFPRTHSTVAGWCNSPQRDILLEAEGRYEWADGKKCQ